MQTYIITIVGIPSFLYIPLFLMSQTLSNKPIKGTQDRFPEQFLVRKYIFDTWRKTCVSFGFEEYLAPLVEDAAIYEAKSWEDVWWAELTRTTNKAWDITNIVLRPEMTPSVTRMVSQIYTQSPKPLKRFSIANFYRNEKPQRWRNREFWQLNIDIFWSHNINADKEILMICLEIMKAFEAPDGSWLCRINHRKLIEHVLLSIWVAQDQQSAVVRCMDKRAKLDATAIQKILTHIWLDQTQQQTLATYMNAKTLQDVRTLFTNIQDTDGIADLETIFSSLEALWYTHIIFDPSIIRWFDYYDGMVFEFFDTHPDNNRSLFGGWRYNGLASIFGIDELPAVWCAPWDESLALFLESWGCIDAIQKKTLTDRYYIPILDESLLSEYTRLAYELRQAWQIVLLWFETQKINKAFQFAQKKNYSHCLILWSQEKEAGIYKIKNLITWEEIEKNL